MYSTLAFSLWEYFTCFFDYIPKIMYFLYAAVASCLDAMQLLMRRLAGLDVYYVNMDGGDITGGTGSAVTGDPVMEFIYGILGIGENAGSYQALNTTFWSLAIFAVIVLVVSTMVALIKSHYQEDGAKTAPLQYIYTAIKAILTFCIVPFAVIIGLMTSNFLLSTLDSITAGSGTEEAVVGIYGPQATNILNAHTDESGHRYYSRYDFFGFGEAANSTTFSGALFKASAYEANRVRMGSMGQESGGSWTGFYTFDGLFGPGSSGYAAATDKREYVAYQIDYAFQNNLDLNAGATTWATTIYDATEDDKFITISSIDVFALAGKVTNFSKYNVGLVWAYYNLWKFNFMVGIASIIVCFGIFISIIIGLMSRLIKSIILFLIYAPTLGLAPMDDFGAFKKWRTEFIQQILMAFGSVIGMNVFFLVLPYINNIAFFNIYLIDAIVSVVVMVTGLMIIKSLISFFSGLVGGADALKEGDDIKGDLGKTLATSAKVAVGVGSGIARVNPLANMAATGIKTGINKGRVSWNQRKAKRERSKAGWVDDAAAEAAGNTAAKDYGNALAYNEHAEAEAFKHIGSGDAYDKEYQRARAKAMLAGVTDEDELDAAGKQAIKDVLKLTDGTYDTNAGIIANKGFADADKLKAYEGFTARTKRVQQIRHAGYMDEGTGKLGWKGLTQSMANTFRNAGGTLAKALMEGILPALKVDPGKILDITRAGSNKKYDKDGKLTGQYWETKEYSTAPEGRKGMLKQLGEVRANRDAALRALGKTLAAPFVGVAKAAQTTAVAFASSGANKKIQVNESTDKQNLKSQLNQERLLREILKKLPK